MATAATTLPTPRIDLSELFRDAWRLARAGAVASACSVRLRLCLGNGLRMAWARARYALARRGAAAALRERIAINDRLMHDVQAEIDAGWGIFARSPEELYEHMDRLHHHGIQMRDELAELEAPAMVPQQAQQQQACSAPAAKVIEGYNLTKTWLDEAGELRHDTWPVLFANAADAEPLKAALLAGKGDPTFYGPDDVECGASLEIEPVYRNGKLPAPKPEPAPAPGLDLSTVEGLRALLVGRTANLTLQGGEAPYKIVGIERWTSPDGALVRDYVKMESTGFLADERKGPTGLYIAQKGTGRGSYVETDAGLAYWGHGKFCDSGNKRGNADDVVKDLLAPIR